MLSRLAAPLRKLESIEGSFSQKRDGRDHSSEHSGDQGGGVFASEGLCVIGGGGGGGGFGDFGGGGQGGARVSMIVMVDHR